MGLKQEMEVAMKLLEKDTHEKQDTLAALRLQLDQVKTLNVQMFHKAQVDSHEYAFSSRHMLHSGTRLTHTRSVPLKGLWTRSRKKAGRGCEAGAEDE